MSVIDDSNDVSDSEEEVEETSLESLSIVSQTPKSPTSQSFESFVGTSFYTGGQVSSGLLSATVSLWSKAANAVSPTSCQRETWNALSSIATKKEHLLVQSATGSGKTIAFLLPVLAAAASTINLSSDLDITRNSELCFPYAVIVAPTRELALQISHCAETIASHTALSEEVKIHVVSAIGGVGFKKQVTEVLSLSKGAVLVVATPGRLLALCGIQKEGTVKSTPAPTSTASGAFDLPAWLLPPTPPAAPALAAAEVAKEEEEGEEVCISLSKVNILVLDEADELIKGGFGKELETMGKLIPRSSATLLTFSATWSSSNNKPADIVWPTNDDGDDDVVRIGTRVLIDESCVRANLTSASRVPPTVRQVVEVLNGSGKGAHRLHRMASLLSEVLAAGGNAIVFVMFKQEAVQVARDLSRLLKDDASCASLQGDMSTHARNQVLDSFRRKQCNVLVATDVAARGIDVELGVSFVLNASVGISIENYVHRCGRTGRPPLNKGTAHTFVVKGDEHLTPALVSMLQASGAEVSEELRDLALRSKQKAEKKVLKEASSGGKGEGGGELDEDEKQEMLEQRIRNREKQKLMQEKKMGNEKKQSKGKGKGKGGGNKKKKGH